MSVEEIIELEDRWMHHVTGATSDHSIFSGVTKYYLPEELRKRLMQNDVLPLWKAAKTIQPGTWVKVDFRYDQGRGFLVLLINKRSPAVRMTDKTSSEYKEYIASIPTPLANYDSLLKEWEKAENKREKKLAKARQKIERRGG